MLSEGYISLITKDFIHIIKRFNIYYVVQLLNK